MTRFMNAKMMHPGSPKNRPYTGPNSVTGLMSANPGMTSITLKGTATRK